MRFNPANYDPADDSSSGAPKTGNLVLVYPDEHSCRCGCKGKPKNPKRFFIQGHDARLKGALTRAAVTDTQVEIRQGKTKPVTLSAVAAAKALGGGFHSAVAGAKTRHVDAAREAKAKADEKAKVTADKRKAIEAAKASKAKARAAVKTPAKKATKGPARKAAGTAKKKAAPKKATAPKPSEAAMAASEAG